VLALLALMLDIFAPSLDIDRDGYTGNVERAAGCNPFDSTSLPYCLPGAEVPASCSSSIPGAEVEPC
jgi:hypothetical protein